MKLIFCLFLFFSAAEFLYCGEFCNYTITMVDLSALKNNPPDEICVATHLQEPISLKLQVADTSECAEKVKTEVCKMKHNLVCKKTSDEEMLIPAKITRVEQFSGAYMPSMKRIECTN